MTGAEVAARYWRREARRARGARLAARGELAALRARIFRLERIARALSTGYLICPVCLGVTVSGGAIDGHAETCEVACLIGGDNGTKV